MTLHYKSRNAHIVNMQPIDYNNTWPAMLMILIKKFSFNTHQMGAK